ncbi:MAG TPA: tetratricopeptide repeat protein [Flavobacterium sp.]|jgi:tetratricopeptide (TPR) repeat protein
MKLHSFLRCLILVFAANAAFAQTAPVDSLLSALPKAKSDIVRTDILNALADHYKASNPELMLEYAEKALVLAQRIKYRVAEGHALLNLGNANIINGNYPKALESFTRAQQLFEKENRGDLTVKQALARVYGSIGIVFSEQSNYAKALQYQLKAVGITEDLADKAKSARIYNNIGVIYQALNDDFRALDYFSKAEKLQEELGDKNRGFTATNMGNIYLRQKNFEKALANYQNASQLFQKYPDARGLGELSNNFGLYYNRTGDAQKAKAHFDQALLSFNSINDKFGAADTYLYLSELYFSRQNFTDALSHATKALSLASALKIPDQIIAAEKLLSEIYERQGNTAEALRHFQLYSVAKDSLANHENIRRSVQAEMNFDFEKREALQKKDNEKRELLYSEQTKRHQIQMGFGALSLLLLCGIAFLIYSRMQLKRTLTLEKELAEYEQKALHLQMNPHFVFNCLGSISSFIVQNGTDSAIKYLSKFSKLMRLTLEYSKESLIPIDKEIESLQNYLELEQLRFNQKFEFSISKSPEIEDDMALPPLLLQPFVENAIIHGLIPKKEQGKIDITFAIEKECLICTISDNGIGFNMSQEIKENLVSVHKSMALDITRKRLEMMEASTSRKAKVDINEIRNSEDAITGTTVVLKLPVQYIVKP